MFTFLDYYRMKPALLPEGVEVIRGKTPAGGAYAVVLYLDSAGRKPPRKKPRASTSSNAAARGAKSSVRI